MRLWSILNVLGVKACRTTRRRISQQTLPLIRKKEDFGDYPKDFKRWEIHGYGNTEKLLYAATDSKIPCIKDPLDVMVKVRAASVNPIDFAMLNGYGALLINMMRTTSPFLGSSNSIMSSLPSTSYFKSIWNQNLNEFPLILGRDFAGVVAAKGCSVRDLNVGDQVYGVLGIQRQGSHANITIAPESSVVRMPANMTFEEAASFPYAAVTLWSAIHLTGGFKELEGTKFLVIGASGGIGTLAVQYLRAKGAQVIATCSKDALGMVSSLGANLVIDYKNPEAVKKVKSAKPYDCVLDLSSSQQDYAAYGSITKPYSGQIISLSSPFISNIDKHGLLQGMMENKKHLLSANASTLMNFKSLKKYAFFVPDGSILEKFTELIEHDKVKPVVFKTFPFQSLPDAYAAVGKGHLRGKVVIKQIPE